MSIICSGLGRINNEPELIKSIKPLFTLGSDKNFLVTNPNSMDVSILITICGIHIRGESLLNVD